MTAQTSRSISPGAMAVVVFLVSVLVLALQIALIRALSVDTYHHFTYLVISTALLGFGASGTLLSIAHGHVARHFNMWAVAGLVLLTVSAAFAYRGAVHARPDMQYVLYSFSEILLLWTHALILFIPFFAGGLLIGMALSRARGKVGTVYAANMIGSGIGGAAGVGLAFLASPYAMPAILSLLGLAALVIWVAAVRMRGVGLPALLVAAAGTVLALAVPQGSSVDQYKPLSHALRIERQGDATHVSRSYGPRGQIDVFDVPSFHHTLFASPTAPAPPEQLSLFLDGAHAGGIFRIGSADQADVLRYVAQSLAYRLVSEPRVAILGERTGVNVWLALAFGAESVVVVQPNPQLTETVAESGVFDHAKVRVVHAEPRLFLERTQERFDIVHLAGAEGMPASVGGLASMREDYLLTVEAVTAALGVLTQRGLITATRGLQTPPRDNPRLFALFAEALRARARQTDDAATPARVTDPGQHLIQGRNYLGVTTIAAAAPAAEERIGAAREAAKQLAMDLDYYPGIRVEDLTERNRVPGPEGSPGSYFYHAAQQILSEERQTFYRDWVYTITPPTDERPYFHSFFKWSSLDRLIQTYGPFWFQRVELGYAVVALTLAQVVVAALILVLVPVLLLRRRSLRNGGTAWTVLHFGAIGLGFLFVEMLHIQRFTRFLGDPIYATAAVLTAILVFSGVGSWLQEKVGWSPRRRIRVGAAGVVLLALVYYLGLDPVLATAVDAGETLRFLISLMLLFPLSFMLGWLMPAGLAVAGMHSRELVPLAWAVNGVASVAATPLSVMIAVGQGFLGVTVAAALCYAAVFLAAPRLAGAANSAEWR